MCDPKELLTGILFVKVWSELRQKGRNVRRPKNGMWRFLKEERQKWPLERSQPLWVLQSLIWVKLLITMLTAIAMVIAMP